MTSTTFFFIFIPLLAFILLAVNLIFAPHNPYQEKDSAFECGFHSFLGQNRTQFSISFFIFALLFLLFDLEILLVYPYIVSAYANGIYGLIVMLIFFLVLTLGFAFELGKNALKIDSRQMYSVWNKGTNVITFISEKKIFNLNNLTYINVFTLSCKTFKDNLSLKVVCTSIFLRLVLSGIVCYLITYLSWSLLEVWLVRILILKAIILFVFFFFNDRIVFFLNNCTRKDLVFIIIYLVISLFVMLAFFIVFITTSSYILIKFAILSLSPELIGSIVWMDIGKLLNASTPPPSTNNTGGNFGGGNGGGGNGGNSSLPALGSHGTNNSNDESTVQYAPPSYPPMHFFNHTPEKRFESLNGVNRLLYFYDRTRRIHCPLHTGLFHDEPLHVYYEKTRYRYEMIRIEGARPMPYASSVSFASSNYGSLFVDKIRGRPEFGLLRYDPTSPEHCGKLIYYKSLNPLGNCVATDYITNKDVPCKLVSHNRPYGMYLAE